MATERFDGSDAIMKLRAIVDAVREYDREMPAQTMLAMFLIGSHPNITQN